MRVLIFTASAGNGHNSSAKRITEKLLEKDPTTVIETVDMYKSYASKPKAWAMEKGYFFLCNHCVSLYNYFFKKSEKSTVENKDKSKCNKEVYPIMYGMLNKIYEFQPDVIVSTYIFGAIALTNLKRYYKIPAKTMCMCLDYGISPYWECCPTGLDYMFLTNEGMYDAFKEKGYSDKQLIVSGIPVSDKFNNPPTKEEARKSLGLDPDMFTVVLTTQSFFPIKNKTIFRELAKVQKPIQIVVVNGKNTKCKKEIDHLISTANLPHKFISLGFTDKIVEIFSASDILLGKAGGLFTTEQINLGLPGLIVDKLPQQEIYNKQYLIDNNCALAVTKDTIADNINHLINNPSCYELLRNSTLAIRKPNALEDICKVITDCPTADYSKINFTDTKKDVIRNVDRERKQTIKEQSAK
ncbi:MAG: hypothetical protein E7354_03065 [Clostridiales bacterium]|nr:hypothetical protein [Clostridiales bacterium]